MIAYAQLACVLSTTIGSSDVRPACQPMWHQLGTRARKFIGQDWEGPHLLDAPQIPNISASLRSSAGGLPFPPYLISWEILRPGSYLLFTPACLHLELRQGVRQHHQDEIAARRCK